MANKTNEERLMKIETQMTEHCKMNEYQNEEIIKRLSALETSLKNEFAGKWTEKVLIGLVIGGITIIITLFQYLI
jgi:hypothetical protein